MNRRAYYCKAARRARRARRVNIHKAARGFLLACIFWAVVVAALAPSIRYAWNVEVYGADAEQTRPTIWTAEREKTPGAEQTPGALIIRRGGYGLRGAGIYPQAAQIIALDDVADVVTVETSTGFIYQYYGVEDYTIGDLVALIMYDAGTWNITDDLIIDARATGFYW